MFSRLTTNKLTTVALWLVVGLFLLCITLMPQVSFADTPPVDNSTNAAERMVYEVVVAGFGNLMMAAGAALDTSIEYFVLDFAEIYLANFGYAIELTWGIIRDLINFALIFGLVYVGFRFILNADEAGAKRNLVTLIIAALLVNFSLFFAKAIVDISNIAGASFASAIASGSTLGIAGSFAETLKLGTAFDSGGLFGAAGVQESYWGYIFLLMVTLLVAAFVFMAAAILIMIRFIVLSFMMVFSPVVVLGWIFPFFKKVSQTWMNTFLGQAFMAPAMLLCLYCSFLILLSLESRVSGSISSMDDPITGGLGSTTFFILGMGFLIGSLIIAQKMGAAGASTAIAIGKSGRQRAVRGVRNSARYAGNAGLTAGARAGQQTLGRRAYTKLNSDKFKDRLKNMDEGERRKAYLKQKRKAEGTYDVRNIGKRFKKNSLANTETKGFQQKMEAREKLESEIYKAMGTVDAEKDTTPSAETKKAFNNISSKQHDLQNAQDDLERAIAPRRQRIKDLTTALDTATDEQKDAIRKDIEDQRKAITDTKEASSVPQIEKELAAAKAAYKTSVKQDDIRAEQKLTRDKYQRQIAAMTNATNKYGSRTWSGNFNLRGLGNHLAQQHKTEDERRLTEKMLEEYGRDGSDKAKQKKKKEDLQILSDQMKEQEVSNDNSEDNS